MGFDFGGTFTKVVSNKLIEISLGDERLVWRSASSLHKLRVLRGEGGGMPTICSPRKAVV